MSQLHLPHWNFHLPALHWPHGPSAWREALRSRRPALGANWRLAGGIFALIVVLAVVSAAYLLMNRSDPAVGLSMPMSSAVAGPVAEPDEFEHAKQVAIEVELPPQF